MIIYTRFIRPAMPAGNVRNVPAYVAPIVEKTKRKAVLPLRIVPTPPKEAGVRLPALP